MKCPNCGTENKTDILFCEICGAALPKQENLSGSAQDKKDTGASVTAAETAESSGKTKLLFKERKSDVIASSGAIPSKDGTILMNHLRKIPFIPIAVGIAGVAVVIIVIVIVMNMSGEQNPVTESGFDFSGAWYYDTYDGSYDIYEFFSDGDLIIYNDNGYFEEVKYKIKGEKIIYKLEGYEYTLLADGEILCFEYGPLLTREIPDSGVSYLGAVFYRYGDPNDWAINFYSENYLEIIDPVNGSSDWEYTIEDNIIDAGTETQLKYFEIIDENTLRSNEYNIFLRYDPERGIPEGYRAYYDPVSNLRFYYPSRMKTKLLHTNEETEIVSVLDDEYFLAVLNVTDYYPMHAKNPGYFLNAVITAITNGEAHNWFGSFYGIDDTSVKDLSGREISHPMYSSMSFEFETDNERILAYSELVSIREKDLIVMIMVFTRTDDIIERILFDAVISSMKYVTAAG